MARSNDDLIASMAAAGVRDRRVLDAAALTPRSAFVPPEQIRDAFEDIPVAIPRRQVTSQPSLVALMVEALELQGHEKVLEVGTGYGYQTALLARLGGFVYSIERFADLAGAARERLETHGLDNVEVRVGDGSLGWPEHAPYDAIVVSCAFPSVPPPLAEQLAVGGRLVQPIGSGGSERVTVFVGDEDGLREARTLTGARFVRLYGEHGFPDDRQA